MSAPRITTLGLMRQILERSGTLSPNLRLAAVVMALHSDGRGGSIYPSMARVALLMGVHRRNARKAIAALGALGFLELEGPTGRHGARRYRLNLEALGPISTASETDSGLFLSFPQISTGVDRALAPGGEGASAPRSTKDLRTSTTRTFPGRAQASAQDLIHNLRPRALRAGQSRTGGGS